MTNVKTKTKYDLEERTAVFAESVVKFLGGLRRDVITKTIVHQAVKSSTSVGANYMEDDAAESKKDFEHKLSICRKEAKETVYWMRIIATVNPEVADVCQRYAREATELVKIFSTIINNSRNNPLV